jgi:hypothetical protein
VTIKGIEPEDVSEIAVQVGLQVFDRTIFEALLVADNQLTKHFRLSSDILVKASPKLVEVFIKEEQVFSYTL